MSATTIVTPVATGVARAAAGDTWCLVAGSDRDRAARAAAGRHLPRATALGVL